MRFWFLCNIFFTIFGKWDNKHKNKNHKNTSVWVNSNVVDILLISFFQTVNIHCKRDARKGVVNNQILDWSFKMDGILHNASQENMYETCAQDVVSAAIDGYNGKFLKMSFLN